MVVECPPAERNWQPAHAGRVPVTYQLYVRLRRPACVTAGRLGPHPLEAGWYVYTGSARRAMARRLQRHLAVDKRLRWHIDFLLAREEAVLEWIAVLGAGECAANRATGGAIAVAGFGASDCRSGCGSHLRYLGARRPPVVPADPSRRRARLAYWRDDGSSPMGVGVDELFEILDEHGRGAGLVPRERVHGEGLWHRAAHVWVFDSQGCVLVQRRSHDKDLNGGLWDISVGEHLQPGETYGDAALRGLHEELGLAVNAVEALGGERRVTLDRPELGVRDYEVQQAFRAICDAEVTAEPAEIAALERLAPADLRAWAAADPEAFTPGFHRDVADLGVLESSL